MKKYILLLLVAAFVSCTKDDVAISDFTPEDGYITFISGDNGTRTAIKENAGDDNDEIVWQAGDKIGIYSLQISKARNYAVEVSANDADKRNVSFVTDLQYASNVSHNFYAYYPYSPNNPTSNSTTEISGNLTPTQDGTIAPNAFMWAKATDVAAGSKDVALNFQHPFTYLDIKLKSSSAHIGKKLHTLTFVAEEGKTLAGDYTLNFTTGVLNFTKTYNSVSASADITLSAEAQNMYMVINPADLAETEVKIIAVLKDGNGNLTTLKSTKPGKTFAAQTRTEVELDVDAMSDASTEPIPIADANFKAMLLASVTNNTDGNDDEISFAEAQQIKSLVIGQAVVASAENSIDDVKMAMTSTATRATSTGIGATQGLEFLTELEEFVCINNNNTNAALRGTVLDLSKNPKLKRITCQGNLFKAINLGDKPELEYLSLIRETSFRNPNDYLDLSCAPKLKTLICQNSINVLEVGVSNCPDLEVLDLYNSQILYLDVSKNTKLKVLKNTSPRFVGEIDVTNCPDLVELQFCGSKTLKSLDVSKNEKLEILDCGGNKALTSIDVSKNPMLKKLNCTGIGLTSLDVSKNPLLKELYCHNNALTTLDVSNNKALTHFWCDTNKITSSFDLRQHTELVEIRCHSNNISSLNTSGLTKVRGFLFANNPNIATIDVSGMTLLEALDCSGTKLTSLNVSGCNLLNNLNCTGVSTLKTLILDNPSLTYLKIGGTGVQNIDASKCPNLESLSYDGSIFETPTVDISGFTSLLSLNLDNSNIQTVIFNESAPVQSISAVRSSLSSVDFACKAFVKSLTLGHNPNLTSLDLRGFAALELLICRHTPGEQSALKSADLSGLQNLTRADFWYCSTFEEINVSNTPKLSQLLLNDTSIKTLDVSTTGLNGKTLSCKTSTLETLILGSSTWKINNIYPTRNASYISSTTEIVFADEL